jgi:hypothetical protein
LRFDDLNVFREGLVIEVESVLDRCFLVEVAAVGTASSEAGKQDGEDDIKHYGSRRVAESTEFLWLR